MKKDKYFDYITVDLLTLEKLVNTNCVFKKHIKTNNKFYVRIMPDLYACLIHSIISFNATSQVIDNIWYQLLDVTNQKIIAKNFAYISKDILASVGLNSNQIDLIRKISYDVDNKILDLKNLSKQSDEKIINTLSQYKHLDLLTIKTWLIFGCNHSNVFVIEDKDIIKTLQYCFDKQLNDNELYNIYQTYSPSCSLLSIVLWKINNDLNQLKDK